MDYNDVASGEKFIASIENLPLSEQNRLLKEQVEHVEQLNKMEMNEMKKTSAMSIVDGVFNDDIDIIVERDTKLKQFDQELRDVQKYCQEKYREANELGNFCSLYYDDEKNKKLKELNERIQKTKRMVEIATGRLEAMENLYKMKVKRCRNKMLRLRTQNYFHYELICDEMYRRMGRDPGESEVYANHLQQKINLERNIIRHNQDLMGTEEWKSSTSSSCTASIVQTLRRDVDRLEQIIDSYCDQVEKNQDDIRLLGSYDDSDGDEDDFFVSFSQDTTLEKQNDLSSAAKLASLNVDDFCANLKPTKNQWNEYKKKQDSKHYTSQESTLNVVSDEHEDEIVNGDEASLSDFSM